VASIPREQTEEEAEALREGNNSNSKPADPLCLSCALLSWPQPYETPPYRACSSWQPSRSIHSNAMHLGVRDTVKRCCADYKRHTCLTTGSCIVICSPRSSSSLSKMLHRLIIRIRATKSYLDLLKTDPVSVLHKWRRAEHTHITHINSKLIDTNICAFQSFVLEAMHLSNSVGPSDKQTRSRDREKSRNTFKTTAGVACSVRYSWL
jgi:hypothetical protein